MDKVRESTIEKIKHINLKCLSLLLVIGRRRRQHPPPPESPLARVLRQKRQIVSGGSNIYNLPATYTVYLPLSCCSSGGVTTGNSLGGCKHLHVD
jgi:hypothetical protein